jgi:hypothetical protein
VGFSISLQVGSFEWKLCFAQMQNNPVVLRRQTRQKQNVG